MNEQSIFNEALDRGDPVARSAYLDEACAGDLALRKRVESLLTSHAEAGNFLGKLAPEWIAEELKCEQTDDETQGENSEENQSSEEDLGFLTPSDKPGVLGRLGHYEVLEVIGRGGMGIVLRAFDDKLHRVVAIKVMATALAATSPPRKRFLREARTAAKVRHEHVVDIHAVEDQPIPYLVMEYVSGETLQQKIDRVGPLETPEVLRLGQQIARGLAAAHAQGLIHRDIKPSNILLEKGADECVKITDFGLARAADDVSLTQSGMIAGTPMYMAPEQTLGEAIDHRADLFSLGSVLYTMCSGRPPFRATTSMATLKRVAEDQPRPIREIIPEVPQWLCDIIARLHAKKAEERFQSAKEVVDLLGQCIQHIEHPTSAPLPASVMPLSALGSEGRTALPSPLGGEGSRMRGRRHRLSIAAAVLLCLIGGLSLTEATGVTNLRATVIRIFTPDGTLVVETDDPAVKVTVEGDGGLVITGAGLEEIRLRPGSYRVQADRDGKPIPLDKYLVEVARGGRAIVKVKLEAPAAVAKAEKGAFVLLGGKGVAERKFDTLAEAVQATSEGGTIEVRGNGPFTTDPIRIAETALRIRAGPGFRPVLQLGEQTNEPLLQTGGDLVLEGLDFQRTSRRAWTGKLPAFVWAGGGSLHAANCRFATRGEYQQCIGAWCRTCVLRNCAFLGPSRGVGCDFPRTMKVRLENCVLLGKLGVATHYSEPLEQAVEIELARSTVVAVNYQAVELGLILPAARVTSAATVRPVRLTAAHTVIDAACALCVGKGQDALDPRADAALLRRAFAWRDEGSVYVVREGYLQWAHKDDVRFSLPTFGEWKRFWGTPDAAGADGTIRYQGGDLAARLAAAADEVTPDDFRLRADSAGYRAGKDGKDLGADVDLVGPGPAYERWKKTPEYQQWLKETGQLRAEAPQPEPKAFVLLTGKGVEVRKFDTLAQAVQGASAGDAIEVRGNGPFFCGPVKVTHALTIRAAEGFRPVLQFAENLRTDAPLVLEGLEFQRWGEEPRDRGYSDAIVFASLQSGALHVANCRFLVGGTRSPCVACQFPRCTLRNCELLSPGMFNLFWYCRELCVVDNCLLAGGRNIELGAYEIGQADDMAVRITRSTLVCSDLGAVGVQLDPTRLPADEKLKPIRIDVSATVFDTRSAFLMNGVASPRADKSVPTPGEVEARVPRILVWRDRSNLYAPGGSVVSTYVPGPLTIGPKTLADWKRYWSPPDGDAVEGRAKYQGGDLLARLQATPEKLGPEDFRLRPDSAGYRAGKDKKDLGADVDLVGPGAAYERWKQTPEYQQWLKDTGQAKK